jgi:hypothetical protein
MNKNLLILALSILTLMACRGRSEQRTEIVEEEIEYRPLITDSATIDSIANSGLVDHGAALAVPDIPKDKSVDMNASDNEINAVMSGSDGELSKDADPLQ